MEQIHNAYIPDDTIAAIATPPGDGAIAIVRICGKAALQIADKMAKKKVSSFLSHTVHLGKVLDIQGFVIDEVLFLVMKNPRSFTGEDTVEIHCHGGSIVARRVLERALLAGARLARPGEFSLRAFMNGKIDLAKAEAIQQIITAKNTMAHDAATVQLQGALSQKVRGMQKQLFDMAAVLEAAVDFPEESLEFASVEDVMRQLEKVLASMHALSQTFFHGKKLQDGLTLCLLGAPNVGKSSLMNALVGQDRAIVTPIAGTTRDLLEENILLGDLHFRLIDTAGIRIAEDLVEQEGIRRAKEASQRADLTLLVIDASRPICPITQELVQAAFPQKTLLVWNKIDLPCQTECISKFLQIKVSAYTQEGLQDLKDMIHHMVWENGLPSQEEIVLTQLRHKQALDEAIISLSNVIHGLQHNHSPEFLCLDMRKCLSELGMIIGVDVTEEILHSIFAKFCIGK